MRNHFDWKKLTKWNIWILVVLIAMVLLAAWGTFAAYVSRSYVKGVAATPKQGFSLSSDYLSAVSKTANEDTYPDRKILLTEKGETDSSPYTFTFSITNSADGSVSTKRIQYYLKMSGLPDGSTVQYGVTPITDAVISEAGPGHEASVMNAYTRVTHTYTVTIPKDKMASAADIIVTATPDKNSDTSGFMLAGRLQPSIIGTVASFSYAGRFLETGNVADYAAFNYQISVSNAAGNKEMKLTWDASLVEIDPLFLNGQGKNNTGELRLTMNDTNSSYLIQFYRLPGGNIYDWDDLGISFGPA